MSLKMLIVLETIFAVFGIIGFCLDSVPRWETWLCCFLFLGLDIWRSLRVGIISTSGFTRYYSFTFTRDDSPVLFSCVIAFQGLLTLICFFVFLLSL
jgi:hypothetical protein